MRWNLILFTILMGAFVALAGCSKDSAKNDTADNTAVATDDHAGHDHGDDGHKEPVPHDHDGDGVSDHADHNDRTGITPATDGGTKKTDTKMDTKKEANSPIIQRSMDGDPGPESEIAIIKTNKGDVKIRFYPKVAPKTVANFKGLAAKNYYDGVTFHRVIKSFMIQGGDPTGTGRGGSSLWGGKFEDETDPALTFSRPGILAMANAGPNTNSSQFFITQVPTPHLNSKHTIFGEVMEGMDVVNAICAVEVGAGSKPTSPIVIQDVIIQ